MILLEINQTDYLTPIKDIPYYTDFISKYSYITISCNVSQGALIPVHGSEKDELDADVTEFINAMPEDSRKKRKFYRVHAKGSHIDVGDVIQENENRTFVSDYFTGEANKNNISPRELVLRTLNCNVFFAILFPIGGNFKEFILRVE